MAHRFLRLYLSLAAALGVTTLGAAWAVVGPWGLAIALTVLSGLCLLLFKVIRPIDQQLRNVAEAAERFGRGELDSRASIRAPNALAELATTFNAMAARIDALVHAQQELLHAVSHELRTPVARMRFGIEMLASAAGDAERQRQLVGLQGDCDELDELVGELLAYARLQHGDTARHLQEIRLDRVVQEAVGDVAATGVPIEFSIVDQSAAQRVWAVPRLLHRAVLNLVGNAARHGRSIVRTAIEVRPEQAVITVDDDGDGVPPAERERIFQPFVRLEAARVRCAKGSGLGLAIARRIAQEHGGEIRIEDSDLGGARFRLELPTRAGRRAPRPPGT